MADSGVLNPEAWPIEDLEVLGRCPCCGVADRRVLYEGLTDLVTGDAPGEWTLWACSGCRCAYLDPRPTPSSIGRAYENYHTHSSAATGLQAARDRVKFFALQLASRVLAPDGPFRRLRRHPKLAPRLDTFEARARHTPRARSRRRRLLDIGFGGADFLKLARWLGYDVMGLDFDPVTVEKARERGFQAVQGSMPGSGLPPGSFDHITLGDVLEHLHDPVGALREILQLLRPGGRLWISQPNLAAQGLTEFGEFWRGLETPRHLTLWSDKDLLQLLEQVGFESGRILPPSPKAGPFYYAHSRLMRSGKRPYGGNLSDIDLSYTPPAEPGRSESLTIEAFRPA